MHEIKKQLKRDIKEFEEGKKPLTGATLDVLHKLTDTYKNICKIEMLEADGEYSEEGGSSYARGRRNARRDGMGRYTSYGDGGSYGEEGYSEEGGGSYRSSYGGAKDHMMKRLGSMMEDASPEMREELKRCMKDLERI